MKARVASSAYDLGQIIRESREEQGYDRDELAAGTWETSRSQLTRTENGNSFKPVFDILDTLGLEMIIRPKP